ncbi:hypothetical protein CKO11_10720 [Rhodobacter sp. TJ_12]|uniref:hypothetical protein n=1 Tax=Rhodobacter sp. TJ_12 TaxID=2029399 RepID=UPI001CC0ECBF|nr:hypothetical protein [Rhodobacter sp. TJ_12]MBZ4022932.1 hypothetical protein [Rhodobacter sp. TJ_12]
MAYSGLSRLDGGFDSLALRRRAGATEIVYDDGVARRMVWRVQGGASDHSLSAALASARRELRVLPALYAELRKRSIAIEAIAG